MKLRDLLVSGAALLAGVSAAQAGTLFGLINTGELYASTNQGVSWAIRSALPVRDAVALAAGSSSSQLYLASASGVVYRSADAGNTWTAVGSVSANDVVDLLVKPDLSVVLLTSTGTVYRSTNSGATFSATGALTGSNYVSLGMSGSGAALFALARTGEVSKSNDNGATWTTRGSIAVSDAVKMRRVIDTYYALTSSGDVYASADSGATWLAKGTLSQVGLTSLTTDLNTLIVGAGTGEVATSTDGASWAWRGAINQLTVRALGVDTPPTTGVALPVGPAAFSMSSRGPNPARRGEALSLRFAVSQPTNVMLEILDLAGRRVAARTPEALAAGTTVVGWNPGLPASGMYFVRASTTDGRAALVKLVVIG